MGHLVLTTEFRSHSRLLPASEGGQSCKFCSQWRPLARWLRRDLWIIQKGCPLHSHTKGVYGNCWTSDWQPEGSTESATRAQVKATHLLTSGLEPGSTSPRHHLRADCYWGRICFWRLLPLEFFCELRSRVSIIIYFWLSHSTMIVFQAILNTSLTTSLFICWLYRWDGMQYYRVGQSWVGLGRVG